ncbi:TPA: multidrug MFS transporter [Streptococcus suis]|nr:multidrug MFS transporter [Streptococcus suis]
MIFVTVGTHEQAFNRLLEEIDRLKKDGVLTDEVFIQTGFSTYEPKYCSWKKFLSYSEMEEYMSKATIVITHGGPATFMGSISKGKRTIVVPRQKKYDEHVNDHQLEFVTFLSEKFPTLEVITEIQEIGGKVLSFSDSDSFRSVESNNDKFNEAFSVIIKNLVS